VHGEQLTFSNREDFYFLMGLPFWGMSLPVDPKFPRNVHLKDLAHDYYLGPNIMLVSVLCIEAMDSLMHHCIVAIIVRIYGSLATQWISGGQLRIMQRILDGDIFTWGLMLHVKMMGKINWCQTAKSNEFSFGSILVAWFLERVPMLRPRVLLSVTEA
jgi:hypothetical protein